jgi:hypothetical protein
VIADGRGRAIAFALAPGQAHELPLAPGLLDCLPDVPGWIVGDRGFASDAFRERIWDLGARPAIPPFRPSAPTRPSPVRNGSMPTAISSSDLPPEQWTPGYADFRSACCGVI